MASRWRDAPSAHTQFGVDAHDAGVMLTAVGVVLAAALLAGYLPARRAPRVDPAPALRAE